MANTSDIRKALEVIDEMMAEVKRKHAIISTPYLDGAYSYLSDARDKIAALSVRDAGEK